MYLLEHPSWPLLQKKREREMLDQGARGGAETAEGCV